MQFDKTEEEGEQYSRGESEYKMKHSSWGSAIVNNKQTTTTTKTTPKQYANVSVGTSWEKKAYWKQEYKWIDYSATIRSNTK